MWIALSIGGGIVLGKVAPEIVQTRDSTAIDVNDAPVVAIPLALCPVGMRLFISRAVKPFTMYAIASFSLGTNWSTTARTQEGHDRLLEFRVPRNVVARVGYDD